MTLLIQDLRYAVRQLSKSPGFTAVALITLALAIGANTAIFSLINTIMLCRLPVTDPQSLFLLKWKARRSPVTKSSYFYDNCPHDGGSLGGRALISDKPLDSEGCSFSFPQFQEIQNEHAIFSSVVAFVPTQLTVNSDGRTIQGQGLFVSGNFFSEFGSDPALGRLLGPTDDSDAAVPTIVVSDRFWQSELGGDRSVVGKHLLLGKTLFTVVGVTGPEFPELDPGLPSDFWLPIASQPAVAPHLPEKTAADVLWIELMARLKHGVSIAQASSAVSGRFAASATLGAEPIFRADDAPRIELSTAAAGLTTLRQNFSQPLFALLGAVTIVLFIACANIAGLMLARSAARRRELAMRAALGATRARIIRQLLTESLLLSITGGVAGIVLGYLGAESLVSFLSENWYRPIQLDVHPDARVLGFTLFVSVVVGIAFGLTPFFSSRRLDLVAALKEGNGNAASPAPGHRTNFGNYLVVVQVALSVLVLTGAGLVVRTLANLKAENIGFDPQNLLVFRVDSTYSNRSGENLKTLYRDLQEKFSSVPGVISATRSGVLLLSGGGMGGPVFTKSGTASQVQAHFLPAASNFLETMHIPLILGRNLNARDSEEIQSNSVVSPVVVNELLVRHLFGTQDPLGRRFRFGGVTGPEDEIVGVVGDGDYSSLRQGTQPMIYAPIEKWDGEVYFEIRTALDPKAVMSDIRAAVARFDSNLLIVGMTTQAEQIDQNIYQERLISNLSTLFALLALIITWVGVYGLLSYQVSMRTQEIGIRLALGAQRGDVLRLVLQQSALLSGSGALFGVMAALAMTRYLESFLFGVKPSDPTTMAGSAFGLIVVALLASYIPARRAMRINPNAALRYE